MPLTRPSPATITSTGPPGFTLVELLIVVMLISIVAAIVVPAINSERGEAVESALKANVTLVSMTLEYQRQKTSDGHWPPIVDQDWFASERYPYHPDRPEGVPQVEDVDTPGQVDPSVKLLTAGSPGAYWYNAANGVFRARVADQGTGQATLDLYNRVNQTKLSSLGASGSSGSGSGPGSVAPIELPPGASLGAPAALGDQIPSAPGPLEDN